MQPNGVVLILCKQIDNYGDVGFCLRLSRALCKHHQIILLHHCPEALTQLGFDELFATVQQHTIRAIDCTHGVPLSVFTHHVKAIVEPFGTSSLHAPPFFDVEVKKNCPKTPWLVLDYLSAEPWVETMHGHTLTEPSTGHKATLFCPGFSHNTAGIIHQDANETLPVCSKPFARKAYLFAYANAPINELSKALKQLECTCHVAATAANIPADCTIQPWVNLTEFDGLLDKFDLLFVRGEDSFVRAQLAGKPFVWNIYPTQDNAHWEKLHAFFKLYAEGLSPNAAKAIWSVWCFWNRMPIDSDNAELCVLNVAAHWHEWVEHAQLWRKHLMQLPDLGDETLKWIAQQSN